MSTTETLETTQPASGVYGTCGTESDAPEGWIETIELTRIITDDEHYPRTKLNEAAISEYARVTRDGGTLPPIILFRDESQEYHLADGRHRLEAARRNGFLTIEADIRPGTRRDALLFAVGANHNHGVRRSNADKRKAVQILLDDPQWRQWSTNEIARTCNVSWDLVESLRQQQSPSGEPASEERQVRRGDQVYAQKVGNRRTKKPKGQPPSRTRGNVLVEMLHLAQEGRLLAVESGARAELNAGLRAIADQVECLIGEETGATRLRENLAIPLNVYSRQRKGGIQPTPEFEKKGLATHAVNVGLRCGHGCRYCSTPSLVRMHPEFQNLGLSPYASGIAIVDPTTPERIQREIPSLTGTDVIQLCTLDDAWSPEAREHGLGRKCLEVLLEETPAQIRVLTKSHHVQEDFDLMSRYPERVIVSLSTGTPRSLEEIARVIEPNASSISERLGALRRAHEEGLRTFAMLCPVIPGIGDSPEALEEMFESVLECGVETIWLETVNARGPGLVNCSTALRLEGHANPAAAIDHIREKEHWSGYAKSLVLEAIAVATRKEVLDLLKVLLYPKGLLPEHRAELEGCERGIVWL